MAWFIWALYRWCLWKAQILGWRSSCIFRKETIRIWRDFLVFINQGRNIWYNMEFFLFFEFFADLWVKCWRKSLLMERNPLWPSKNWPFKSRLDLPCFSFMCACDLCYFSFVLNLLIRRRSAIWLTRAVNNRASGGGLVPSR